MHPAIPFQEITFKQNVSIIKHAFFQRDDNKLALRKVLTNHLAYITIHYLYFRYAIDPKQRRFHLICKRVQACTTKDLA